MPTDDQLLRGLFDLQTPTKETPKPTTKPKTIPKPGTPKPKPGEPEKSPWKVPRPIVLPEPKNVNLYEQHPEDRYEREVHPSVIRFWGKVSQDPESHILGKHPIFSYAGKELSKESYYHTAERMDRTGASRSREGSMRDFFEILHLEAEHKSELKRMAIDVVCRIWGAPAEMFDADIVSGEGIEQNMTRRHRAEITPEVEKLAHKRVTLNALMQGSAVHIMMTTHYMVEDKLKGIEPRLVELYDKFTSGSHGLYWFMDIEAAFRLARGGAAVGSVRVDYSQGGDMPVVKARAICFPLLVHELSKGVMEVLSFHGLDVEDEDVLRKIYTLADPPEMEHLLIQVGPALWRKFIAAARKAVGKSSLAHVVAEVCKLKPDELHKLIYYVLHEPDMAEEVLDDLISRPEQFDVSEWEGEEEEGEDDWNS